MKNNCISVLCGLLVLFSGVGATPAFAQFVMEKSPPDSSFPQIPLPPATATSAATASSEGPVTVTDVIIDKTDKNAVVAREAAIVEAQRKAFEVLAQRSMSPEDFKAYNMPDSKTIATLVDDFEIKNEQISTTRYVANFTVRFLPDINNYIKIPDSLGRVIAAGPVATTPTAAATAVPAQSSIASTPVPATATPAAPATPQNILVLPYFESASGKKVLWEDPNPWRDAWEEVGSATPAPNLTISVPLGDLTDVSSGSTDAVWKGDYSTIEKARANYNATEIALAVAHPGKSVDLFLYKDGKLEPLKPIIGKYYDQASYKKAITRVIAELKAPVPVSAPAATHAATAAADASAPPPPAEKDVGKPVDVTDQDATGGKVVIEATMNFGNYSQWMEAQKRLAEISPPVDLEISSLTKDQAQFTMDYDGGGMAAFKTALAGKGLTLDRPTVEVDESVLGSDKPTQKTVYELRLQN